MKDRVPCPRAAERSAQPSGVIACMVAALMAFTGTCVAAGADQANASEELVSGMAKWSRLEIKTYTFQLHFTGHEPGIGPLPAARIQVRDGKVVGSILLGRLGKLAAGSKSPLDPYLKRYFWLSIDDLFGKAADSIEYAKAHPAATLRIDYDAARGFPSTVAVDNPESSDGEGMYVITEFRGAAPGRDSPEILR